MDVNMPTIFSAGSIWDSNSNKRDLNANLSLLGGLFEKISPKEVALFCYSKEINCIGGVSSSRYVNSSCQKKQI